MPNMPDLTPAQLISWLTALLGAVVTLFQLDLTDAQRAAAVTIITVLVSVGWFVADAIIRHGRSRIAAAQINAAALPPAPASDAPTGPPATSV